MNDPFRDFMLDGSTLYLVYTERLEFFRYIFNFQFNETRIVMSWNPEPSDLDLHTLQVFISYIFY